MPITAEWLDQEIRRLKLQKQSFLDHANMTEGAIQALASVRVEFNHEEPQPQMETT